jgi:anti-sigma regulatory factor (Ser/Thr protein kinase)
VEDSVIPSVRPAPGAESALSSAPPAPPAGDPELLDRRFGRDEIAVLRREVYGRLTAAGLGGERLQGFVLAVNEVLTNVVLHAGGQGRAVLWLAGGSVWCAVSDGGPGIPARYLRRPEVPDTFDTGGRGIWLAHQLCDEVTVATGPIGTTIGLRIALPRRATSA